MKHFITFVLFTLTMTAHSLAFNVGTINYEATGASTAKVVSRWPNYSGDITIPSQVTNSGTTYTVNEIDRMAFLNAEFLSGIVLPATLTTIGDNAFAGCTAIQTITIPAQVTSIGSRAFAGCTSLTTVTLNNRITSLPPYLFYSCSRLKNVVIPKSVTSIGTMAFGASGIEKINIDKNVKVIEFDAFNGCSSLKRLDIDDLAAWCNRDFDSGEQNPLSLARYLYLNNEQVTTLTLPSTISTVKPFSFVNCMASQLVIPPNIKTIDLSAFIGCSRMYDILIPHTVTKLISDNLSATEMPFYNANKIVIGRGIKEIPDGSFDFCTKARTVILSEGLESIGFCGFGYCGCVNIVLPSTVKKLTGSFFACNRLQSITLNRNITEINGGVLGSCVALKEIHSLIQDPYQVQFKATNHFNGIPQSCVLYVPKGTLQRYRSHPYWGTIANIEEEPGFITDVNRDGHTDVEDVNLIINFIIKQEYPGANLTACDVNRDNRVDVEDVNALVNAILHM